MTARLLAEAHSQGVTLYRVGDRLRWRAATPIAPELGERLREHRVALLALVSEGQPATVPTPSSAKKPTREAMDIAATGADAMTAIEEASHEWLGLRLASRILGQDVWLVPDDESAEFLERELAAEGGSMLVFTIAEVFAMEGMLAAEMRAIARIKRTVTRLGGRIDSVARHEGRNETGDGQ